MSDVENVIIIGSGPAGYTAALYTARANLHPLVIEGFAWGGLLQQTTDVENYPGFPEGVMGPEMMQKFRDQAERFGARLLTEQADRVELASEPGGVHSVWVGRRRAPRAHGRAGDGRRAQEAGRSRRGGALRPRCQLLRDLRRGLLPRGAHDHRRRRRLGDGGGDLPVEVRVQGDRRASPRRVPRVEDHARARARAGEHRVPDALPRRASSSPARTAPSVMPRWSTRRPARSARYPSRARSSRSATSRSPRSCAARSTSTRTAT